MRTDKSREPDELRAVLQEKGRLEKQIRTLQQRIDDAEGQLTTRAPTTRGYQKVWENLRAWQASVAELYGHLASLDEAIRDLRLSQEDQPRLDPRQPS